MPFETDEMEWVRRLRKTASDRKELPKIRGDARCGASLWMGDQTERVTPPSTRRFCPVM